MDKRLLTAQQELFLSSYINSESDTFSNAFRSALLAGYSESYAENITHLMPEWLSEYIGKDDMLKKAERNLSEVQDISIRNEKGELDAQLIDKRTKVDIFIAKTLGKAKYSERQEVTGANGEQLQGIIILPSKNENTLGGTNETEGGSE